MQPLRKSFISSPDVAGPLSMTDLCLLPRTGFKGSGTADWLAAQGLVLPDQPNQASKDERGRMIARLSWGEFLLLGDYTDLGKSWSFDAAPLCFALPRADSHAWFLVSGDSAPKMMAKICGVDLRPQKFPVGTIAQTSVARLSCVVIADKIENKAAYHLLSDSSSAQYLWDCLSDAMLEFNGAQNRPRRL